MTVSAAHTAAVADVMAAVVVVAAVAVATKP